MTSRIVLDPANAFSDEQILARALNTLGWYDLMELLGPQRLGELLSGRIIGKLFPNSRITFYKDARRLLSKYFISCRIIIKTFSAVAG